MILKRTGALNDYVEALESRAGHQESIPALEVFDVSSGRHCLDPLRTRDTAFRAVISKRADDEGDVHQPPRTWIVPEAGWLQRNGRIDLPQGVEHFHKTFRDGEIGF